MDIISPLEKQNSILGKALRLVVIKLAASEISWGSFKNTYSKTLPRSTKPEPLGGCPGNLYFHLTCYPDDWPQPAGLSCLGA